jgi:opacity protein-like surface antigen
MESKWRALAATAALFAVAAPSVAAAEVEQDVADLRDMVLQLKDELRAERQRNEDQETRLEEAGLEARSGARSALSSFLESTDFYGWVAGSYTYNVRGTGRAVNSTFFYPDSNTFAVDQLWFGMDKAPSEESRGGFHVDLAYGKHSSIQGNIGVDGNDSVSVFAAYASYLAPIGNGIQFNAGELWTLIGAEVVQTGDNFNITRGLVWGLQPVTHTGITASTELGGGFSLTAGFVNDVLSDTARDTNGNKAFTGQLAWSGDTAGVYFNAITGDAVGSDYSVLDLVATLDPTDSLSMWLNYDYILDRNGPNVHGLAIAARLALTDRLGFAARGETVIDDKRGGDDAAFSATATLDYALTDNLTARGEYRYDTSTVNNGFINPGGPGMKDDQHLLLAQLLYAF